MKLNAHVNIDCISADRYIKCMKENVNIHIKFADVLGAHHFSCDFEKKKRQNHYGLIVKICH